MRRERLPHRRKEVAGFPRRVAAPRASAFRGPRVAGRNVYGRALDLAPLGLRIEPMQLDLLALLLHEAIDADEDLLAASSARSCLYAASSISRCDESLLDRRDRAAELVDALDQLARALFELARCSASMK